MVRISPQRRKLRFQDLSPAQKAGVVALGVIQGGLAVCAWRDLARRPAAQVRGSRGKWAGIIALNFLGPVLYFTRGRRSPEKLAG